MPKRVLFLFIAARRRAMTYGVRLRVWGERACFTRPEMKVERVSYDVMTPSAARGILEAVHWKPAIRWVIDRIHVLKPIRFQSFRRNEVGAKISADKARSAMKAGSTAGRGGGAGLHPGADQLRRGAVDGWRTGRCSRSPRWERQTPPVGAARSTGPPGRGEAHGRHSAEPVLGQDGLRARPHGGRGATHRRGAREVQ